MAYGKMRKMPERLGAKTSLVYLVLVIFDSKGVENVLVEEWDLSDGDIAKEKYLNGRYGFDLWRIDSSHYQENWAVQAAIGYSDRKTVND